MTAPRGLLRLTVLLITVTFLAGFLVPSVVQLAQSFSERDAVQQPRHGDEHDCPDPADRGHPCSPACACSCCHPPVIHVGATHAPRFVMVLEPTSGPSRPADTLHPRDLRLGVFHPPRLA